MAPSRHAFRLAPAALAALLLAVALPAAAQVRVCVDKDGRKSYQQKACPSLGVNTGIQPLARDRITEADVRKTVGLMNQAFVARDTAAFAQFLAADFTAKITGGPGLAPTQAMTLSRDRYLNRLAQAHKVTVRYEETSTNDKVTLAPEQAVYGSRIRSRTVVPNGVLERDVDQDVTLVIEGGRLLVVGLAETVHAESMSRPAAAR